MTRIDKIQKDLEQMNQKGYYETDIVTRGRKGKKPLGSVIVRGFPFEKRENVNEKLILRQMRLKHLEQEILEAITKVEEFISNIEDIRIRRIFVFRYVDGLNYIQIAHRMHSTADGIRMEHSRFLEKL